MNVNRAWPVIVLGEAEQGRAGWPPAGADPHEVVVRRVEARGLVDRHALQGRQPLAHQRFVVGQDHFGHTAVDGARQRMAPRQVVGT